MLAKKDLDVAVVVNLQNLLNFFRSYGSSEDRERKIARDMLEALHWRPWERGGEETSGVVSISF